MNKYAFSFHRMNFNVVLKKKDLRNVLVEKSPDYPEGGEHQSCISLLSSEAIACSWLSSPCLPLFPWVLGPKFFENTSHFELGPINYFILVTFKYSLLFCGTGTTRTSAHGGG